jgi:hypothetical protein
MGDDQGKDVMEGELTFEEIHQNAKVHLQKPESRFSTCQAGWWAFLALTPF